MKIITKFKEFYERYTGPGSAIGFRYSDPNKDISKWTFSAQIKKGNGSITIYEYGEDVQIPFPNPVFLEIPELEAKLKNALTKVGVEPENFNIKKLSSISKNYLIYFNFYVYSENEATSVIKNVTYTIRAASYDIVTIDVNEPEIKQSRIGFKYKGSDDSVELPLQRRGAYGEDFPAKEFI